MPLACLILLGTVLAICNRRAKSDGVLCAICKNQAKPDLVCKICANWPGVAWLAAYAKSMPRGLCKKHAKCNINSLQFIVGHA